MNRSPSKHIEVTRTGTKKIGETEDHKEKPKKPVEKPKKPVEKPKDGK